MVKKFGNIIKRVDVCNGKVSVLFYLCVCGQRLHVENRRINDDGVMKKIIRGWNWNRG